MVQWISMLTIKHGTHTLYQCKDVNPYNMEEKHAYIRKSLAKQFTQFTNIDKNMIIQ